MTDATSLELVDDLEIVMTRVFDAPREVVFAAWTEPEHVVRWWGPRGSSLPVCEVDLRPGGAWRYVHRAPDGSEHPFKGVFLEVVPPERLVSTEIYDVEPYSAHEAVNTVLFADRGGRTELTATTRYPSAEVRAAVLATGMEAGARETFDRLAEHLATLEG